MQQLDVLIQHARPRWGGGSLRAFRHSVWMHRDVDGFMLRSIIQKYSFLSPQTLKNRALERSWKRFWGVLRCLGQSWRVLNAPGACLESAPECQRAFWRRLRSILRRLGGILERLGRILEGLGTVLEAFWEHFGSIFGRFFVVLSKM